MTFKKAIRLSLIMIIIILIFNIFIINNQAHQIKDLTKWLEAVSDRQLRSASYLGDRVGLIEAQIKELERYSDQDYDNIWFLSDEVNKIRGDLEILKHHHPFYFESY